MQIAALYDIHGNLPALEAVLADVAHMQPDLIVVGGDIISGPMPRATLECLLALEDRVRYIRGNADREVVAAYDGLPVAPQMPEEVQAIHRWTAEQLERSQRDFLAQLPEQLTFSVADLGDVLFCHATPRSDEEIFTVATSDTRLGEILNGVKQQVIVCGHTHMQFDRRCQGWRIFNAGSVGMPYGAPGAYWLAIGAETTLHRTEYALEAAAARIRACAYPFAEDFAENNVLIPPTASEAVEVFERMAQQRSDTA